MKKLMIVCAIGLIAGSSWAAEVLSEQGKEVSYVKVATEDVRSVRLQPASVFVGERLIKDDAGHCIKETSVLKGFSKGELSGLKFNEPIIEIDRNEVNCPAVTT